MKKFLMITLASLIAAPALSLAQYRDPGRGYPGRDRGYPRDRAPQGRVQMSCNCLELDRRITGLRYVINNQRNLRMRNYEANQIQRDLNRGIQFYNQAAYARSDAQSSGLCSQGNVAVDQSWRQWQPYLARIGVDRDRGYQCRY